jgi:flagellar secretion chaperone FliS
MARMAAVRDAYSSDTVVTTPERLITMLYDRLARDLVGAEAAIERKDREVAHSLLLHGQEIVFELLSALDVDAWEGAADLARLYTWMLRKLAEANLNQDPAGVRHVRSLVEPLGEAWHAAANEVATGAFGRAV